MDENRKSVNIYTDGACSGNPGPGGYGVILRYGDTEKTLSQGFKSTTNNRMELLAVIVGLEAIKWKNADIRIAGRASIHRVVTQVAIAFGQSVQPLTKMTPRVRPTASIRSGLDVTCSQK